MKRILVVGGSGFIGSSLVEKLVNLDLPVRALDRPGTISPLPAKIAAQVEWVAGDFTCQDVLERSIADCDVIFHLASTTLPKSSNDDPEFDVLSNLAGTIRLLTVAARLKVKKVIFPSSGGTVYGVPMTLPVSEDHPNHPLSSYGITKLAIEKYLELFRKERDLEYVALRVANPFGPYHNPIRAQGAVGVFLARAIAGEPIEIWGDGHVVRDYLYVSDLIDAMIASMHYQPGERVFNVGSGQGRSLNDVIESIRRVTGIDVRTSYLPKRSVDLSANVLGIERMKSAMNWTPKVDFDEGVDLTYRSLIRNSHEGA
jgi:UDP-glucose 4-epimerase